MLSFGDSKGGYRKVNIVKRIVLILISLVVVVYGLAFMIFGGVNGTLLDKEYYHTVVGDNDIAQIAHGALETIVSDMVLDGLTGGADVTDPAQKAAIDGQVELISTAVLDALDPQWIGQQIELVTDDIVQGLTEDASLSAVIDLSGKIDEIEANIAEGLQQYSDAELMAMFGAPKAYIPTIAGQIVETLSLPESFSLKELTDEMAPGVISMGNGYLISARTLFSTIAVLVVLVVFFLLCILLAGRRIGAIWFGVTIFISGALFRLSTTFAMSFSSVENLVDESAQFLPVPGELIPNIIKYTTSQMGRSSNLFLIVGAVFILGGIVLARRKEG